MRLLLPKIVVWQRITAHDPARAWLKLWNPLFLKGLYIGSYSLACNRRFKRATTRELDARVRGGEGRKEWDEREREKRERDTKPAVSRGFLSPPGTISGHFSHFLFLGPKIITVVTSPLPGLESFGLGRGDTHIAFGWHHQPTLLLLAYTNG